MRVGPEAPARDNRGLPGSAGRSSPQFRLGWFGQIDVTGSLPDPLFSSTCRSGTKPLISPLLSYADSGTKPLISPFLPFMQMELNP